VPCPVVRAAANSLAAGREFRYLTYRHAQSQQTLRLCWQGVWKFLFCAGATRWHEVARSIDRTKTVRPFTVLVKPHRRRRYRARRRGSRWPPRPGEPGSRSGELESFATASSFLAGEVAIFDLRAASIDFLKPIQLSQLRHLSTPGPQDAGCHGMRVAIATVMPAGSITRLRE
jgi:hypothetical protein